MKEGIALALLHIYTTATLMLGFPALSSDIMTQTSPLHAMLIIESRAVRCASWRHLSGQVRPLRGPVKTLVYIGYTVSFAKASTMDAVLEQVRTNCRQIMCMHLHNAYSSKTQALMDDLCPRLHCSSIAANSSGQCPIVSRHSMH